MDYGTKYSGSAVGLDGNTYTVEILKYGYEESVIPMVLGKQSVIVRWGQQGDEIYRAVLPSFAEIQVFDKTGAIKAEIFNADDSLFRMRIKKGSSVYWFGKMVTDVFEGSLNLKLEFSKIAAFDGLAQLDDIGYEPETRVSLVQAIADLLADVGLDLNIRFACNWFTPDIAAGEDPCAQINVDPLAMLDDQGNVRSSTDALTEILERHGLQLYQSDNVWWVVQRELRGASSFTYFEYSPSGVFVQDGTATPVVIIDEDTQYGRRLNDGRLSYRKAYKTTSVEYAPKPGTGSIVSNGSFEDWSDELPAGWLATDDLGVVSKSAIAADGVQAISMIARYDLNPDALPTDYLSQVACLVSGGLDALQIRVSAYGVKNPNGYTDPTSNNPRKAYFKVFYGDYYLHRAQDGTVTWVPIGQGNPNDDYILLHNAGVNALYLGWQEDLIVTPPVPVTSGQLTIRLYPLTEFEFTPEQEQQSSYFSAILYDNVIITPLTLDATLKTVTTSIVLPNTINRDTRRFVIGDGPTSLTANRLTIGASTLTGNWKRGPYEDEDPTGTTIDAMLTETWMRAQKTPLEVHEAVYIKRASVGYLIEAHNAIAIGSRTYAFVYLERNLLAAHSAGEWVEIKAEDDGLVTTTEAITPGSNDVQQNSHTYFGNETNVGSKTFASGLAGSGWGVRKVNGKYTFFADNLELRGSLVCQSMLFMQARTFNGTIMVARTGTGKPSEITEVPLS